MTPCSILFLSLFSFLATSREAHKRGHLEAASRRLSNAEANRRSSFSRRHSPRFMPWLYSLVAGMFIILSAFACRPVSPLAFGRTAVTLVDWVTSACLREAAGRQERQSNSDVRSAPENRTKSAGQDKSRKNKKQWNRTESANYGKMSSSYPGNRQPFEVALSDYCSRFDDTGQLLEASEICGCSDVSLQCLICI